MDSIINGWFSEINELWPGQALSLKVKTILDSVKSKYQDILLLDTESHGKVLVLDGIIQCSERDEFAYQEMITFLPLCSHPRPRRVLIVGGGDGGVAREVAKHPDVEEIHQVEIDEKVIEFSKRHLEFMAKGFDGDKLQLHVGDGFEFMKSRPDEFDVIITDSSDPVGPAVSLFRENYFSLARKALRANGIICSQAGTVWTDVHSVRRTLEGCKRHFPAVAYAVASVPTYPTGQIGFIVGSLDKDMAFGTPEVVFTEEELDGMDLKYYDSRIHSAAFVLPRFARKGLS